MPLQKPLRRYVLLPLIGVWLSSSCAGLQRADAGSVAPVEGDETAVGRLVAALVEAKTDEERWALLVEEKELVTLDLQRALAKRGRQFYEASDYPRALTILRLAESVAEQIGDQAGAAKALNDVGNVYSATGSYSQALEYHQKSLALSEALQDDGKIAVALNSIGKDYSYQGDYDLAIAFHQRSLTLAERLGDKEALGGTLKNIGVVHRLQGNYALAMDYYQKALPLLQASGNRTTTAYLLNSMGLVPYYQGNYGLAMEYLQKSLAQFEELGDREGTAYVFGNIGALHNAQGNYSVANEYFQRALAIHTDLATKGRIADQLSNIGEVHAAQGNYVSALEYYRKSLALREPADDKNAIAYTLNNIGDLYSHQSDYAAALEHYLKSLALREAIGDRPGIVLTLNSIASVHEKQGGYQQALEFAERAASIARQISSREGLWQARTTEGIAYRALRQPAQARQAFEEAIAAIESLRAQVAGGEEELQHSFESKVSPYHAMVELLIDQGQTADALSYAERAKGRVLLDVLRSGRVSITKSMTPKENDQERSLTGELVSLNTQISGETLRRQPDLARLGELRTRLQRTRLEHEGFQARLYAAHPELRVQRGEARTVAAAEVGDLLPENGAALEYVVTQPRTYLLVLAQNRQGSGVSVEGKAYSIEIRQQDLAGRVESFRRRLANRDFDFQESAHGLYELLLRPAQAQLEGKTTLVIVPDGILWDLPFQALLTSPGRFLVEDHAVFYSPSLTVLREMRKGRKEATRNPRAAPRLLAIGNPALEKQTVERVQSVLVDERPDPLPDAERQVEWLRKLYGRVNSTVYVGTEAREDRVKAEVGKYDVLHLATHGILNDASPMYSHLLLAQGQDPAREDGLLEAWEIMGLDLKTDLVVLSACETARGRVGAGEGVIGLTWAFFVAGSPTTVVSQWKVVSASTSRLMLEFHRNLTNRVRGKALPATKAEALRRAALRLLHSDRYWHPFYWAGFVVVGDGH